ncbi:Uncharacterised protein [Shigella sonnei]|nr:hypothetical protein EN35_36695 [Rhodococcus qingshengii]CSI37789.1 Uncharacterised protein [Shigella sonnei]
MAIFMNCRDHNMRWRILIQLENIFTQIGFNHLNASILQHMIDTNLFGHHRFRFHHLPGIFALGNL